MSSAGSSFDIRDREQCRQAALEALAERGLSPDLVALKLSAAHGSSSCHRGMPVNGYESCIAIRDKEEELVATVMWGRNPGVNIKTTGFDARALAPAIREIMPHHRVSRADAALDFSHPGLFDRISRVLIDHFEPTRVRVHQVGNWDAGYSRTLYIGSRSSASQLVVYEKGYKDGKLIGDPYHVRIEARVYPDGKAGEKVAEWEPRTVFGGTRMLADASQVLGLGDFTAQQIGTTRGKSDMHKTRRHMVSQYRRCLTRWLEDAGSWEELGVEIEALLSDIETEERALRASQKHQTPQSSNHPEL